jgi:hypothetical protein
LYYIPFLDFLKVRVTRKGCSAQDLAGSEKASSGIGDSRTMTGSGGLRVTSSKVFFDK